MDLIYRDTARRIIESPRSKEQMLAALASTMPVEPKIIRCKDCDYWYERKGEMYCGEMYFNQDNPDFYCGYAERRTDGSD